MRSHDCFCANCGVVTEMNRHGKCWVCGSEAVDILARPVCLYASSAPHPTSNPWRKCKGEVSDERRTLSA